MSKLTVHTKKNMSNICKKTIEIQKKYKIGMFLATIDQWDIDNTNQFKSIKNFQCLVCSFKTNIFYDWKCHIMSVSHMKDCDTIKELYSYVCCAKKCKALLYGSRNSLCNHVYNKHSDKYVVHGISNLMAEVMKRKQLATKQKPLYFCSHCKRFQETPIHTNSNENCIGLKVPIEYYCSFCNVIFISSPEMIDYHSLSVEHMTIKCFDLLCATDKVNLIQIKVSEQASQSPKNNQSPVTKITHITNDDNGLPAFQNELVSNSIKLPMIMLNRFKKIDQNQGECKLCSVLITWQSMNIIKHLFNCDYKYNLTGINRTNIETFMCVVCDYYIDHFDGFKKHITSHSHLIKTYIGKYYSNLCIICNILIYGQRNEIINHWNLNHKNANITMRYTTLATFMEKTFDDFNKNPNRVENVHYYCTDKRSEVSKLYSKSCITCKIEFHTSSFDYNLHKITSEHIILKFLTPKSFSKSQNKLITECIEQTSISSINQGVSLLQNNGYTKDDEYKELRNNQKLKISENIKYQYSKDNGCQIQDFSDYEGDSIQTSSLSLPIMKDYESSKKINHTSNKLTSTPYNSVDSLVMPYDLNDSKENIKERKRKTLNISTSLNELGNTTDENENPSENIFDKKRSHELISIFSKTTLAFHQSLINITKFYENKIADQNDNDKAYGEYVTERLKYIKDLTIKHNIKLEIDQLFYSASK